MTGQEPSELRQMLARHGQEHLLQWWSELTLPQRNDLRHQIESIDIDGVAALVSAHRGEKTAAPPNARADRVRRARPPGSIVRLPSNLEEQSRWDEAQRVGEGLLKAGRVGALLVAGGLGTRLGFDRPKGMFPIGPVSGAPLFQILAEQVLARSRRSGRAIPYFIMTSRATHDETLRFFAEHRYFGFPAADVFFFEQGEMPAVDSATGRLLLSDRGTLSTSPDGHGGILTALARAGLLEEMARRGIDFLHYHQVDNPTAVVCDPAFLGFHRLWQSEMSTKVVAKRTAAERMGVVVDVDGRTEVIEYTELPPDVAAQTDPQGSLLLWAGNTAIHVFDRQFLERIAGGELALPFHIAHKKVPFCDQNGQVVHPEKENAWKFERFIFDALPVARRALVLETDRQREFNPVKNATGDDSPQTAQAALISLFRTWLQEVGAVIDQSCPVEISPLFALDRSELCTKIKPGTRFTGPVVLR
jgi:UDP-N-acetylglucosamine/UDP-N-acetylgalactosamine diphosphorylase